MLTTSNPSDSPPDSDMAKSPACNRQQFFRDESASTPPLSLSLLERMLPRCHLWESIQQTGYGYAETHKRTKRLEINHGILVAYGE